MSLKSAHTGKIGKAFINARILRSMTCEEVADATLINVEYIKAIESGNYAIFPARMFAVQYFEKYANFLNLEINFFDIYNAEVVAAAEKELNSNFPERSFFKKNIIIFICLVIVVSLIFIFQRSYDNSEASDISPQDSFSNEDAMRIDIKSNFDNDIGELHYKINDFFIQDKLDSIQPDVTVDLLEPEA